MKRNSRDEGKSVGFNSEEFFEALTELEKRDYITREMLVRTLCRGIESALDKFKDPMGESERPKKKVADDQPKQDSEKTDSTMPTAGAQQNPSSKKKFDVEVIINDVERTIEAYQKRTVVDDDDAMEPFSADLHIRLSDARKIDPDFNVGDIVRETIDMEKLNRIAVGTFKHVLTQDMREAEREHIKREFEGREKELFTVKVIDVSRTAEGKRTVHVEVNKSVGVIMNSDLIPDDECYVGKLMKAVLKPQNAQMDRPDRQSKPRKELSFTRTGPDIIKRLFELEVPEIKSGVVEIVKVAREPGLRTKIAVRSTNPQVDPVGACLGARSSRIKAITDELGGKERIDIIEYSDDICKYVVNALSPARITYTQVRDENNKLTVYAYVNDPAEKIRAIGKNAINVRLAANLTNCVIQIEVANNLKGDDRVDE